MKHLYIIGNGFDIYTGLATRYSDFRLWLENSYPFIYENLQAVYDIDVEYVHIYGFSFSTIDEDYIDWVFKNVSSRSKWEVSWFTNEDKNRIDRFVLEHWGLKDRLKIIRLEEIAQKREI